MFCSVLAVVQFYSPQSYHILLICCSHPKIVRCCIYDILLLGWLKANHNIKELVHSYVIHAHTHKAIRTFPGTILEINEASVVRKAHYA